MFVSLGVGNNSECRSTVALSEEESLDVIERSQGEGAKLYAAQAVETFKAICIKDQQESLSVNPDIRGLTRLKSALQIGCCMRWEMAQDASTDAQTVSVVTVPDCNGCGETISRPDEFVAQEAAGLIATALVKY